MASVRFNTKQGHPTEVRAALRRAVSAHAREVNAFKIGRTSDPEARARARDYSDGYEEMIVLYATMDANHAHDVERDLIDFFEDRHDNFRGGGGGPIGVAPYYVYMVTTKSLWRLFG